MTSQEKWHIFMSVQDIYLTDLVADQGTSIKRLAGSNHIVQRIYFRDLPGAQLGSNQSEDVLTTTVTGSAESASRDDSVMRASSYTAFGMNMGSAVHVFKGALQQYNGLSEIAKLFDSQANMFAMEYMRNGDVRCCALCSQV